MARAVTQTESGRNTDSIRSPLRFPGGKSRVGRLLLPYLPPHRAYREVFAGGAGVFFRKPKAGENWLNDAHPGLYAFYTTLRDAPEPFIARCAEQPPDLKETFAYWTGRTDLMTTNGDDDLIDRAVQFYFINRTVWGGRVVYDPKRKSRLYFSNPQGWGNLEKKFQHLRQVSEKLQGATITNRGFEDCFRDATPDTFIYCDPPYVRDSICPSSDRLYDSPFTMESHHHLAASLAQTDGRVMLSYDDCPEARALYAGSGWRIIPMNWTYSGTYAVTKEQKASQTKETKIDGRELLILNYDPPDPGNL